MRRWMLVAAGAAVVGLAVAVSAGAAPAQNPGKDSVAGSFTVGEITGAFAFEATLDAESGPTGENPEGTFVHTPNGFASVYSVACLRVSGNTAVVGVNYVGQPDYGLVFRVVDGAVDTFAAQADRDNSLVTAEDCTTTTTFVSPLPIISGDIAIHDAHPLPTSKDQCRNGGWRSYGVFKNQGDCVSYAATGGKNPPGGH
jgi:hypothetical protein